MQDERRARDDRDAVAVTRSDRGMIVDGTPVGPGHDAARLLDDQCRRSDVVRKVGFKRKEDLRAALKEEFVDEELAKAAERLYDPNFDSLKLWRWLAGVGVSRGEEPTPEKAPKKDCPLSKILYINRLFKNVSAPPSTPADGLSGSSALTRSTFTWAMGSGVVNRVSEAKACAARAAEGRSLRR